MSQQRLKRGAMIANRFRVEDWLGQGSMGVVYRAQQVELDRPVAMKFLTIQLMPAIEPRLRLQDEARVCARLNHTNIVQIFEVDFTAEPPFIVFELIEGESLRSMIDDESTPSVRSVLLIMAGVFEGLHHAHTHGVVHRDLKPENVLVTREGTAKIADFGLAKLHHVTQARTRTGLILGTPDYMSPEQVRGEQLTLASDLYSAGVVLFETVTSTTPFARGPIGRVMESHASKPPPRLRSHRPQVPQALDTLVAKLLEKSPARRPKNGLQVAKELRAIVRDVSPDLRVLDIARPTAEAIDSPTLPPTRPVANPLQRWRWLWAIPLSLSLLAAVWHMLPPGKEPERVRSFDVMERGSRAAVLVWRGSWWPEPPRFSLTIPDRGSSEITHDVRLLSVEKEGVTTPEFVHTVLVTGLRPRTRYAVALRRPSGPMTTERTFETLPATTLGPSWTSELGTTGSFIVRVTARKAFRAFPSLPPSSRTPSAASAYDGLSGSHILVYQARTLLESPVVTVLLTSVDDERETLRLDTRDVAASALDEVFADFVATRASRSSPLPDGLVESMRTTGWTYRESKDMEGRKRLCLAFWVDLEKRLGRSEVWYQTLSRLLPGLSHVLGSRLANDTVRQAAARAFIPLEVVCGMARAHGLAMNPRWRPYISADSRPYPMSYTGPHVKGTVSRRAFHLPEPLVAPWFVYDQLAPEARHLRREVGEALTSVTLRLRLTRKDVARTRQAELVLRARSCMTSLVTLVEVNDQFTATYWDHDRKRMVQYQVWLGSTLFGTAGGPGRPVARAIAPSSVSEQMAYIRSLPWSQWRFERKLYHRLPVRCLREGENTATVTVIASQDRGRSLALTGLTLRLGR